jgi:hypothetical protein
MGLQNPYLNMLKGLIGQESFGYKSPDLSALLGGEAGGSPEAAVKAMYGAMQGDIDRQRSKGAEMMENRNISMGRSPTSGTATAGMANFLGDFDPKAAANMAGNRLNVGQFGLQAAGRRDAYMGNVMSAMQNAAFGGRSRVTESATGQDLEGTSTTYPNSPGGYPVSPINPYDGVITNQDVPSHFDNPYSDDVNQAYEENKLKMQNMYKSTV